MRQLGLTGGIASGKSTASRTMADLGAVVIDADQLAREVLEPGTPGHAAVVAAFGDALLSAEGALDRAALGRLVFADADARHCLEAVIHPLVRARTREIVAELPPATVVVHDLPLLVETGASGHFDLVLVVDCPVETQVQRLVTLRGLTRADALARIGAQASREQRLAVADVVLDGSGSVDQLATQVRGLWGQLVGAAT